MKFLFVDDDWEIAMLADVLRELNPAHTFDVASTLSEAREVIWKDKFDALILDVMMPPDEDAVSESARHGGMFSGVRLAELVRNDSKSPNQKSPILFLTALHLSSQEVKSALDCIPSKLILRKPVHPEEVFSRLTAICERK